MLNYFLPPATEQQIAECEKLLGVRLPQSYRTFLLCTNGAVIGIQEGEYELVKIRPFNSNKWDEAEAIYIIMSTDKLFNFRKECFAYYNEDGENIKHLKKMIPFCYDGAAGTGDFYALDFSDPSSSDYPVQKVYLPPSGVKEYPPESNSFFEWIESIFNDIFEESDDASRIIMERYLNSYRKRI